MPLVIGLTGGMGVGKSTVAGLLAEGGATVIDVDGVGRAVLEPEGGAFAGVVAAFGAGVVGDDGRIDRGALAAEVFGGDGRLAELEAISHPAINAVLADRVRDMTATLVLDMAVLTESRLGWIGEERLYHRVIVVETPLDLRFARLADRGVAEDAARARIAAQASDHDRRLLADVVITNDGDLDQLRDRVDVLRPTIASWEVQEQ
ncbi:MAG: dephospho-CoA kinase [Actinomycetota bacterium]